MERDIGTREDAVRTSTGYRNSITQSLVFVLLLGLPAGPAGATPPPRPAAYAVLVGSNRAGPGQKALRYAQQDARRVLDVLTQVGGFTHDNISVVLDPGREQLLQALDGAAERLRVHSERGEPSLFLFYYSGHARARALNMGPEELPLIDLRRRLTALPATVSVAILDACQTGAISQIKGARPAADFSYNSVNDLRTAGVAVMASSAASELSQEARTLGASYFTHHLVVGLRGAADEDEDGKVSLSEAYRYAYNRTLVATAATAVGKQHVTLETRLKGKGEMVLTFPASATSVLELPARLEGQVLVHRAANKVVVAELTKAAGRPLRLALPSGSYVALVKPGERTLRCELALPARGRLSLTTDRCEPVAPARQVAAKQAPGPTPYDARQFVRRAPRPWRETVSLEVGFGGLFTGDDGYNTTLEEFRFEQSEDIFEHAATFSVAAAYALTGSISLVAGWSMLDSGRYEREAFDQNTDRRYQYFSWSSHAVGLYGRWTVALFRWQVRAYLQGGAGVSWGHTRYEDDLQASTEIDEQTHWGFHLAAHGGLQVMPLRNFGFFGQVGYIYAPAIDNELGQSHNSGGPQAVIGLRGAL